MLLKIWSKAQNLFNSRSPSYPPPGCGKSKSKLKPEQDGIPKSQKLLKRNCSNSAKVEDGCDSKPHKPIGRSFSSDPRTDQTNSSKPHKLLSRSCSATMRLDENLPLKSHKLLSRTCSGDTRCEHNSAPKPHKLLSKSCSSTLKTEDTDGLKHHKLLSRSYSSNAKVGKTELCKEPTSEGRRLSLTSGLIGILAPSSSSQPTVRTYLIVISLFSLGVNSVKGFHMFQRLVLIKICRKLEN